MIVHMEYGDGELGLTGENRQRSTSKNPQTEHDTGNETMRKECRGGDGTGSI